MSRIYTIHLVGDNQPSLEVRADDVDLDYGSQDDHVTSHAAFNFLIENADDADLPISVAWVPFEMVKAIVS